MAQSVAPVTRPSLLARVKDPSDRPAWEEFAEIYWPTVYRWARKKGLQHADAEDLAQQVLASAARAIDDWQPDPERGRFRTWLYRIAHNQIINALTRMAADRGSGDSGVQDLLSELPADDQNAEWLADEHRREVFRWAARRIRGEFHPDTWDAFWMTAIEGNDVEETARKLQKNCGAVYAARSRVMRRLKEKVREYEEE